MAANGSRGQSTTKFFEPVPGRSTAKDSTRIQDWLRDPETPASARRMDPPAAEPSSHTPVLNRLTAQFDRLRHPETDPETPGLTEMMQRRLEARRAREAEIAARILGDRAEPVEDHVAETPDDLSKTLHAAIADIIDRQHSLDETHRAHPVVAAPSDSIDAYFGIAEEPEAAPPALRVSAPVAGSGHLRGFFNRLDNQSSIATSPVPANGDTHSDVVARMESAVDRLAEQFEQTAHRGFETLENCHSEIMRTIRESRSMTIEAAEAAAARSIETNLETLGGTLGTRFDDVAHALAELKADNSASERRTCDMLDAVRETLEIVAARLPAKNGTAREPELRAERPVQAPERSRFIAAARRQAGPEVPSPAANAEIPPAKTEKANAAPVLGAASPISASKPKKGALSPAKALFRRRLMFGAAAAALLLASYGGAMMILERTLAPASAPIEQAQEDPLAVEPGAADDFSTVDAGAPPTYRPSEPAEIDAVPPLPDTVPASPSPAPESHIEPDLSEPSMTGSIPSNAALSVDPLPPGMSPLERRLAAGDPAALHEQALRFIEGRGVPRDPSQAIPLLQQAADAGLVPAQYLLGNLTEKGTGLPKDITAARKLYEQAAASGNIQSMHNLGVMQAEGAFGKADITAAADWFARAADLGLKDSQFNLGVIKARGLGGKPDLVAAYQWFAIAAAQGDTDAAAKRDQIGARLGKSELATAKSRVTQWKALPNVAKANIVSPPSEGWDLAQAGRASTNGRMRTIR
ncbi:hypothetical protein [Terrihabitans sp. B22-R8]|uniref:hypothetical protein n=1 Tax=Terrihabitans sp. B22-R8 TaxID=3425128 RepID=UPI00403C4A4E